MASHDLINTKPTILGATLGAIPGIAANPPARFSFAPTFSERFFKNWGGPRAPDKLSHLIHVLEFAGVWGSVRKWQVRILRRDKGTST